MTPWAPNLSQPAQGMQPQTTLRMPGAALPGSLQLTLLSALLWAAGGSCPPQGHGGHPHGSLHSRPQLSSQDPHDG